MKRRLNWLLAQDFGEMTCVAWVRFERFKREVFR